MLNAEDNALLTQVGPKTPMGKLFREFWLPFMMSDELPAPDCPPVEVTLLGEELVAYRDTEGNVGLLDAYCPHRTARLFFGRNENCGLRCVYHGWKFDREGKCMDMPSEPPESTFKEKIRTTAYKTCESGGFIWAYMGKQQQVPEMPLMEWLQVPDSHRYGMKIFVDCNYMQAMEGDIDSSHSAFLHSNLEGKIESGSAEVFNHEKLRKYSFKDKAPRFFVKETDYGCAIGARRNAEEETYYWRVTQWMMPAYSLIPKEPHGTYQCNMRVPIDDHTHWFLRVMWNPERVLTDQELYDYKFGGNVFPDLIPGTFMPKANKANDYLIDRSIQKGLTYTGIKGIPVQDQACTEGMGPIAQRIKEHLGTSDTAIIKARHILINTAKRVDRDNYVPYPAQNGSVYHIRSTAFILKHDESFDQGMAAELLKARYKKSKEDNK